jgi:hypothetical protein
MSTSTSPFNAVDKEHFRSAPRLVGSWRGELASISLLCRLGFGEVCSVNAPRRTTPASVGRGLCEALRVIVLLLVFGTALWGVAQVVNICLPIELPVIDEKLAHFAAHKNDYDTLFFGSSRTYRHLLPSQFDAVTAAAGVPTKSFNFGIDGMFPPEDGYVAEKLFALKPQRLKRVFIEISFFRNHWFAMDPESARALHWHDGRRLLQVAREQFTVYSHRRLSYPPQDEPAEKRRNQNWRKKLERWPSEFQKWWRFVNQPKDDFPTRVERFSVHLRLYLRRSFGVGRAGELVARYSKAFKSRLPREAAPAVQSDALGPAGDGASPTSHMARKDPEFVAEFEQLKAERLANPAPLVMLSAAHEADLSSIIALVRTIGAEPILYISPDVLPCRRYPAGEKHAALLDFTEIAKYPELFHVENRIDISHLDGAGAKLFTDAFARRFLEHENSGGW